MDIDPQNFFGDLIKFAKDEKKGPSVCLRLVETLNRNLIEEQLNSSLVDLYLIHIFDKSNGLINFVNSTVKNKNFKNSSTKGVEILYTLVKNFPTRIVESNALDIYTLCISITKLDGPSEVKVKSLELLLISLEKLDICIETENVSSMYKEILGSLQNALKQKHTDTVKHKELIALGFFIKRYQYLVSNHKELQQLFIRNYEPEVVKPKKSQHVICGFFTGFSYYCEAYPLNPSNSDDKKVIERLYSFIKVLVVPVPTERMKIGNRAALSFLSNNGGLFGEYLLKDYKFWHSKLLNWLEMGPDDKKVGVVSLRAFFQIISTVVHEKSEGNWQSVVEFFNSWCKEVLKKENASNHEKRLAIECLRFFSAASYKYLPQIEVTNLFLMIMEIFEYNYILNYNPSGEEWEYLPFYVQTVANLMQFKMFAASEFYCLQRAVINMIKSFHQLPPLHYDLVIDGIVTTCFYLKSSQYFDAFVENVIYQGVVWSCSHDHISKAEFSEDSTEKLITVKNFSPLWLGILRLSSNRSYDKYGMYLEDRKFVLGKIVNQLVKTLMVLINKLNISVRLKEGDNIITELEKAYQVEQLDDYAIFLNVIDFYQEILNHIEPKMFESCICKIIKHVINKCVEFPLVSGFYKLLSYSLNISNKLNLFNEDKSLDITTSKETLRKFIEILLEKMVQYKDELLIACLQVLLECPIIVIKYVLPACIVPFLTIFNVGRSFLPLAEMGLNTLEYWQNNMNSDELNLLVTKVIPNLDTYLRSKTLQGQAQTNIAEKRRKTIQPLKKRKVLVEFEPELFKLQKRILAFIGKQSSKICEAFVYSEHTDAPTLSGENFHLKVPLPYEDVHVDIHLDSFIQRIVNLALYSSDRKARITACELLQATVMVFLGKAKAMSESGLSELEDLLRTIAMPLLQLSCDIDQLVQQIFEPLFLQLIHWYTFRTQLRGSHSAIIIDVLMEGISHPTDSHLRDFSGKCINEFVKWTIKQTTEAQLASDPVNIKVLVKRMRYFSSHPDPAKKLGAALIFNNIYREIREEETLINVFWLEILHIFVSSLALIEKDSLENDNLVIQINTALSHLQRVIVERAYIFRERDDKRRIPSDIKGCFLKDVAVWLFEYTGNKNKNCRERCMDLFIALAPLMSDKKVNLQVFIEDNFTSGFISDIYEDWILKNPTLSNITYSEDCNVLLKWMQGFLCMVDGYNFVIKNNLGDINFTNNVSITAIDYFLRYIHNTDITEALNLIKHKTWIFTSLDREQFNRLKSVCILSILKFYNSIINNDVLCKKAEMIWTTHFWHLISNSIFCPHQLGLYDGVTPPKHLELLAILLNGLPRKVAENKITELVEILHNYIAENYITSTDVDKNASLTQRNIIKGLRLLSSTNLNKLLKVEKYANGLVNKLIQNFYSKQDRNVIFINELQETTFEYCVLTLKFVLPNDIEFESLINHLCQPFSVQSIEFNKEIIFGIYFLSIFGDVVIEFILKKFDFFLNSSMKTGNLRLTMDLVMFILSYVRKNRGYKEHYDLISKVLLDNWDNFKNLFNNGIENMQLGIDYLKLFLPICKLEVPTIRIWLIERLVQEDVLNNKLEIFYLLVKTADDTNEEASTDLESGLLNLSECVSSNLTTEPDANALIFHKMLTNTPAIKSTIIIKFFIELYSKLFTNFDVAPFVTKFVTNNDEILQQRILKLIYDMCCDDSVAFESRYKIIKDIVPPIFRICNISSFEKFYVDQINDIIIKCQDSNNLYAHILDFVLIEVLFLRIPIGTAERSTCPIAAAANNPKLLQFFVKFSLDAFKKKSTTFKDIRLYKCHAYNALASIVSNSLKSPSFYEKLFVRQEDSKDILWDGIIDTNTVYDFPISFDSIPSQRKVLLNIRDELRAHQKRSDERTKSMRYIESQRLFNSSLSEDVTNFDFTNTMLRNDSAIKEEKDDSIHCEREIQLEAVNINNHECMATICGLIQHIFDSGVNELPREDEDEIKLPNWMQGVRSILLNQDTHRNIKIFLIKVIDNMIQIFSHYAKWFLEPLLQFIVDKCAGDTTNYFITDVVIILTKWATKISELNENEQKLVSDVLIFLISNLKIDRLDMFKYNLDLIKLLIESWKNYVKVPFPLILQLMSSENSVEIGIHLTSVFLVNNLPPWQENKRDAFIGILLKRLESTKKSVYRPCSETTGLALRFVNSDQHKEQVNTYLKKITDFNKYVYCLEGVAIHFPQIVNSYHISKLICSLNQFPDTQKILHLKIIHRRVAVSLDILEEINDFKIVEWDQLLENANLEIQIITLQIIKKCLTVFINYKCYINIVKTLSRNVTNSNALYRSSVYDLAILIYQQKKDDLDICKEILIFGLVDHDVDNREKVIQFWMENPNVPKTIINRFPYLLSNLYKTKMEDQFLGYVNYFLITVLSASDDYNTEIFEHPLEDCDFEDYQLKTNWRLQHPSVVPLFAETLQTYSASIDPYSETDLFQLRETQSNLAFTPTQSVHEQEYSKFVKLESSLGVSTSDSEGSIKNPNQLVLSQKYRSRRRFLKDKSKISIGYAHYETQRKIKEVQRRYDLAKEKERKVAIYRKYRKGDFPDIQISLSAVLKPLQMLSLHDSEVAKVFFIEIFKGLLSKTENNGLFTQQISDGIRYIFENSTHFNPNLFSTLLDILLRNKDKIRFEPKLISYVSQQSGLVSIGALLLEEYLTSLDSQPSGSKMGAAAESGETIYWVKLAELYKELEEWDVVRSIFVEKMNCKDIIQQAIKCESEAQWREAQDLYKTLIGTDLSVDRRDFYYESYFKCFANLGEWEYLPETIESVVTSTKIDNVWDNLWDNGWCQQKLLPWYIDAQVKNILFNQTWIEDFSENINRCLSCAEKAEYLQTHFSEELCIMWMFKKDIPTADYYLQTYIKSFLGDWQLLNPLFHSLRYKKVLKLRNIIETCEFISVYNNLSDEFEIPLKKITNRWQKTSNEMLPSILLNETRVLYRTLFINLLKEKISRYEYVDLSESLEVLKSTRIKLDVALIETATELNNYYMARKYFKKYAQNENLRFQLAGTLAFLKSKMMISAQQKLTAYFHALNFFRTVFQNSQNPLMLLPANIKFFDIVTNIFTILKSSEEFYSEYAGKLGEIFNNQVNNPKDIGVYASRKLRSFIENLEDDTMDCDTHEPSSLHQDAAKAYVKLAHFTKDQNDELQDDFILYVLRAMKLNSSEARQLFPCILTQNRLGTEYKELFITEAEKIPTWMFLAWIPQLLANVDSQNIFAISKIIKRIAETYPQAIMYPYRLSKENYSFKDKKIEKEARCLINSLDELLSDKMVDKFLKALSYVSVPAGILKYYVTKMRRSKTEESIKAVCISLINDLLAETPESRHNNNMQGNMFKKISKFKKDFIKIMSSKNDKIKDDLLKIHIELDALLKKEKCSLLLKDYCPWLANFSANKLNIELEIPGQYTGHKMPLPQHHVKISGFYTNVSIMNSIRKPIKLTILGMDTKEYPFLVKFGEDLRQDQRIEQLFALMNDILISDTNCIGLDILTYQVIPLTSSLGIIQWINDTQALSEFVEKPIQDERTKQEYDKIRNNYENWLCRHQDYIHMYGKSAVKYSRDKTISFYRSLVNRIPWDVIKTSFWSLSIDTENYIALRNNFIKSYAVLCGSQWIIGIGDRHLDNSLICIRNGKVLGIDFGHAFGTATQILPVPELVPFRLTPHIISFMEPLKERGPFRECMIHCLRSLRNNCSSLLATMNVFVQEPSLDWLEHASKFEDKDIEGTHNWYPNMKVDQTKRKLEGVSSAKIVIEDLTAGQIIREYTEAYVKLVKGEPQFDIRAKIGDENLTVESQVDCLIDHATDYNLLGRMYAWWKPWV